MVSQITIFIGCLLALCCYTTGDVQTNNCDDAVLDLYLIVDSSSSINATDFEEGKKALHLLVDRLNVGRRATRVNVINYSTTAEQVTGTATVKNDVKSEIMTAIDSMKHTVGARATGLALEMAKNDCGPPNNHCRPLKEGVARAFVLFTNGQSNDGEAPGPIADAISNSTIAGTIFVAGIGDIGLDGKAELEIIADNEGRKRIGYISSYLELTERTNDIATGICNAPVFILPKKVQRGAVKGGRTRYYRMATPGKESVFKITLTNKVGLSSIFASTATNTPDISGESGPYWSAGGSDSKHSLEVTVPATVKYLYIALQGKRPVNKFEFVVHTTNAE